MEWETPTECSICGGDCLERSWTNAHAFESKSVYDIEVIWREGWYCCDCFRTFASREMRFVITESMIKQSED